jgi:demethoxyubiquinone hydroxylase (CLK1/Coq7/Cat5 family)
MKCRRQWCILEAVRFFFDGRQGEVLADCHMHGQLTYAQSRDPRQRLREVTREEAMLMEVHES